MDPLVRGRHHQPGVELPRPADRRRLYMPIVPETVAAYLAIVKISCIVLPLYSGFGADPS